MKSHGGRPPKSGIAAIEGRLEIRVTAAEKDEYELAAQVHGLERSEWIRAVLNAAAKRALATRGGSR